MGVTFGELRASKDGPVGMHPVDNADLVAILEIGPDTGKIHAYPDAMSFQFLPGTYT